MKIITLGNKNANELGKIFLEKVNEIESKNVIIHLSTFFNMIDEEHKALIVYEE
jgi:arginine deiminase